MQRIIHSTATVDNKFRPGNPQEGQKATVVTSVWANSVQEELANFIESRGIALDVVDESQLTKAIADLKASADGEFLLLNNQANTSMGAEFSFDIATVKSVVIDCDIYRTDSLQEKTCVGKIILLGRPKLGTFDLIQKLEGDEDLAGVEFSETNALGVTQLKYSTTNYVGANYEGKLVFTTTVFKI